LQAVLQAVLQAGLQAVLQGALQAVLQAVLKTILYLFFFNDKRGEYLGKNLVGVRNMRPNLLIKIRFCINFV
jgi:hypothetical protein